MIVALNLSITTRDVGLTQVATIRLGSSSVTEFYTHTKYEESSLEIAQEFAVSVPQSLFTSAINDGISINGIGGVTKWRGEPGGSHE